MMFSKRFYFLPLLFAFLLAACNTQAESEGNKAMDNADPTEIVMRINHYMIACEGEGSQLCMLTQMGDAVGGDDWEYFYDQIQGFETYRLGYIYDLVIKTEKVKRPPQDASSVAYTLVKVQSKSRVKPDTRFVLSLTSPAGGSYVTGNAQAGFALLDRIKIICENKLCGQLAQQITSGKAIKGTFIHSDRSDDTIVLQSLAQ